MMYPRLRLARNLLKDDGVIFISISDIEVDNIRKVCNEIFGESNFLAQLIWTNQEGGGSSDSKYFRIKHEYILCFAKDINKVEILGTEISNLERYTQRDEFYEIRGPYYLQKLGMGSIQYSESLDYKILAPDGTIVTPKDNNNGKKACWRWSEKKFNWGLENGFVEIKKDSKGIWTVYTKQYLKCDNEGHIIVRTQRPFGVIDKFSSTQASKFLDSIGLGEYFDYSKPIGLIEYLIERICKTDDYVLDFFSGSATTANAIINLNSKDNGSRKYIMVQLPEVLVENNDRLNSEYSNICEVGKERIRRVGQKIIQEAEDKDLDIGFKVFKLDDSNINTWDSITKDLENTLFNSVQNIKEDRTQEDLLYELMLKMGIELTAKIEEIKVEGKIIYNIQSGGLVICLEDEITNEVIDYIPTLESPFMEMKVVFKEYGFKSDADKMNAIQNLKQHGIKDVRSV